MISKKNIILIIISAILIIFNCKASYAIGEFSIGANIGVTQDLNNLNADINRYNTAMELYKDADSDAKIKQIPNSYCLLWGLNFQYQFNFLLFRTGATYGRSPESYRGYITPNGGTKNKIKIMTYQCSFPLSIALIAPLKERTYFYMGAGLSYHIAYVKISQTNPDQTSGLSSSGLFPDSNKRNRYTADFPGFHFIFGAEAPVPFSDRFTMSVEWIHQEGRSGPLANGGADENGNDISSPKKTINVKGDLIIFSIKYYIAL